MSRTYRKPYMKGTIRFFKKYANRVVRKAENIADGNAYKKCFCSWEVCDFRIWCGDYDQYWQYNRK